MKRLWLICVLFFSVVVFSGSVFAGGEPVSLTAPASSFNAWMYTSGGVACGWYSINCDKIQFLSSSTNEWQDSSKTCSSTQTIGAAVTSPYRAICFGNGYPTVNVRMSISGQTWLITSGDLACGNRNCMGLRFSTDNAVTWNPSKYACSKTFAGTANNDYQAVCSNCFDDIGCDYYGDLACAASVTSYQTCGQQSPADVCLDRVGSTTNCPASDPWCQNSASPICVECLSTVHCDTASGETCVNNVCVAAASCSDSDNSQNPPTTSDPSLLEIGNTVDDDDNLWDFCSTPTRVVEMYCDGTEANGRSRDCPAGNSRCWEDGSGHAKCVECTSNSQCTGGRTCVNNACSFLCTDSDNTQGFPTQSDPSINVQGFTQVGPSTQTDYCNFPNSVVEYFCITPTSDAAGAVICPSGICSNGACCVPSTEVCNGVDDDCDGSIDEGGVCGCIPNCQGNICGLDPTCGQVSCGSCEDNNECTSDSCNSGTSCSNTNVAAGTLCTGGTCDGAGNCVSNPGGCTNGELAQCPLQLGVCASSFQTCTGGAWPGCSTSNYGQDYEPGVEITCSDLLDNDCDGEADTDDADCPIGISTPIASLDYQPAGAPTQTDWTKVLPNPGTGWDVTVSGVLLSENDIQGTIIENDILLNAKRDYHLVPGSEFSLDLPSTSPQLFRVTIHSGSPTLPASETFNITVEQGTSNEITLGSGSIATASFVTTEGDVQVDDGTLNIEFGHLPGVEIAISGMEISSFCGDSILQDPPEECDDGAAIDARDDGDVDGDCIIDPSPGGLMCETNPNVCGDGYMNSTEECDGGSGCSSSCEITGPGSGFCEDTAFVYEEPPGSGNLFAPSSCADYNLVSGDDNFLRQLCEKDCVPGASDPANNGVSGEFIDFFKCKWDLTDSECYFWYNTTTGDQCRIDYLPLQQCGPDDAFRSVIVNATAISGTCDAGCGSSSCETQIPCPRIILLPFFNMVTAIMSFIAIMIIYLVYTNRKK